MGTVPRGCGGLTRAAAVMVVAACGAGDPAGGPPGPAPECRAGVLRASSTEGERFLALEEPGGEHLPLEDATGEEVGWLNGTEVEVCGTRTRRGALTVAILTLTSVDGQPAHLGVIQVRDGVVFLDPGGGAGPIPLLSAPGALTEADGRTAWVTGRETERGLVVQAHGLRPPGG